MRFSEDNIQGVYYAKLEALAVPFQMFGNKDLMRIEDLEMVLSNTS